MAHTWTDSTGREWAISLFTATHPAFLRVGCDFRKWMFDPEVNEAGVEAGLLGSEPKMIAALLWAATCVQVWDQGIECDRWLAGIDGPAMVRGVRALLRAASARWPDSPKGRAWSIENMALRLADLDLAEGLNELARRE